MSRVPFSERALDEVITRLETARDVLKEEIGDGD